MKQLQQGDVLLQEINKLPDGLKKIGKRERGYVLADGETTGHAHVMDDCDVYERDGVMYISTSRPVNLVHEEHNVITVPAGLWEVGIVQEYDPFAEELRNVRD